jgi:hypothetical protein
MKSELEIWQEAPKNSGVVASVEVRDSGNPIRVHKMEHSVFHRTPGRRCGVSSSML